MYRFSWARTRILWLYLMLYWQSAHGGALHTLLCWAMKPHWLMRCYLLTHTVICPYLHSTTTEIPPAETKQMFTKMWLNEDIWKACKYDCFHFIKEDAGTADLFFSLHTNLLSAQASIHKTSSLCFGYVKMNILLCIKHAFLHCCHHSSSSFSFYNPRLTSVLLVAPEMLSATKFHLDCGEYTLISCINNSLLNIYLHIALNHCVRDVIFPPEVKSISD